MRKLTILLAALAILISSCKDKDNSKFLTNVTGKSGEVILVISPEHWSSNVGREFEKKFKQPYPGLPQEEPIFHLVHIPYKSFTSIFRTHRNIVFVKIDKKLHEPKMIIQKDVWAKPQIVVNVIAPDDSSLVRIMQEKGNLLVEKIWKKEIDRYKNNYKKYAQNAIADRLDKKFGIRLTIPRGYSLDVDTTDFVWIENKGLGDLVQGILIYQYDKPNVDLTTDYLIAKRTQYTKRFVPGPNDGSYMAVERDYTPIRREMKMHGVNVIQLRGLWKVENDFMGGPFVSFSFIDEKQNKVVNIDGFVYAPQFKKKTYVEQLEAILNTFQVSDNESTD